MNFLVRKSMIMVLCVGGSVSLTGYGSGFVMGYDSNGKRHSKFDDKKHGYDD